jgi:Fe2+ transport system protein B
MDDREDNPNPQSALRKPLFEVSDVPAFTSTSEYEVSRWRRLCSKYVMNAKTFCYRAAHVIMNILMFLEAMDRLNSVTTFTSYLLIVYVQTTEILQQMLESV